MRKFNELRDCVNTFLHQHENREVLNSNNSKFITGDEFGQLCVNMITRNMAPSRVIEVWSKTFPYHNISRLINDVINEGFSYGDHIVYGFFDDDLKGNDDNTKLKQYLYSHDDIQRLLRTLNLVDLASVFPKISTVKYVHV